MLNLLRTDFRRFKKDKLILINLIITVAMALVSTGLYFIISKTVGGEEAQLASEFMTGRSMFLQSLSPLQNMGILTPVLLSIVLVREYTTGTIRNKLTCGYSRTKIFLSGLITILTFGIGFYALNALLNLGFGSLFFGYGANITASEFGHMIGSFAIAVLIYITFYTFATLISNLTKSMPGTIVSVIGYSMVLGLVGSILISINDLHPFFDLFLKINSTMQITMITEESLTNEWLLYSLICSIIYLVGYTALGIFLFKKTDVK